MASPGGSGDGDETFFDPAQPFRGVVICCTSIPPEQRSDIGSKAQELGGLHKYDLTPDCTHLIVGEYDTPKYRHVAKERPDVKVMSAHWVTAVRDLWIQDADIDFAALEKEWQLRVFETGSGDPTPDNSAPERGRLLCCMTGFDDPDVRQEIADKIQANGGLYTGDLRKAVTHLIVYKPEGRKYQAAKNWGIHTVSVEWVNDSVERGLILDEKCYDPILPPEERGVGAWNRDSIRRVQLGKRLREASAANQEDGRRKLRKTASMKLNSQRDNLWGDILGKSMVEEPAPVVVPAPAPMVANKPNVVPQQSGGQKSLDTQGSKISSFGAHADSAIFDSCCFYIHGFEQKKVRILADAINSLGGLVCHSVDEVTSTSGAQLAHRFLIVPQNSAPETHPSLPDNVHIITEFYIERCMHNKYFFDPSEHVIGRPFPAFPIPGFEQLSVCTAGFTGVDLNQVDKAIRQLGGKYEEKFTAQASLLVCSSLAKVRKQKLDMALAWKVPVVSADWLWECISTGYNVPFKGYLFPELRQRLGPSIDDSFKGKSKVDKQTKPTQAPIDQDLLPKAQPKSKSRSFDVSGFTAAFKSSSQTPDPTKSAVPTEKAGRSALGLEEQESNATTHFETAPTHQLHISITGDGESNSSSRNTASAPLSETSTNSLNRTQRSPKKPAKPPVDEGQKAPLPTQSQQKQQPPRKPMSRITSEIADSEATDGDLGTPDEVPLPTAADENRLPQHEEETESPEEFEKRRKDAEKEAQRLAISSKFASLLDSAAPEAATDSGGEDQAGPVPRSLTRVLSGSGATNIGGGSTTRRRKREILGRAISNVSAASSGSADSITNNNNNNNNNHNPAITTTTTSGAISVAQLTTTTTTTTGAAAPAVLPDHSSGDPPPPLPVTSQDPTAAAGPASTQLEYQDPEANLYKKQLMDKMLGGGSSKQKHAPFQQEEKLTLGELGGYDNLPGGRGGQTQNQRQGQRTSTRRRG